MLFLQKNRTSLGLVNRHKGIIVNVVKKYVVTGIGVFLDKRHVEAMCESWHLPLRLRLTEKSEY